MAEFIAPIQRLIEEFRRLPGVGAKTAARYAFAVLNFSEEDADGFAVAIKGVKRDVYICPVCGGLSSREGECDICSDQTRDSGVICVVENAKDVMTMERVRGYRGATNPTPAGDTTAGYLANLLEEYDVSVSRLAYGIPVGADIEYADEMTLYRAMEGRRSLG